MSSKLSVDEVLSNLEARAVFHREQEAFHAAREVHHREQKAVHAAELVKVQENLEAFRSVAATAVELATPVATEKSAAPAVEEPKLPAPGRLMVGKLVWLAVKDPRMPEPFGPKAVAAETYRRFRDRLSKPIDGRTASDVLRRMRTAGEIELVRKGTAFHEALYRRKGRPPGGS